MAKVVFGIFLAAIIGAVCIDIAMSIAYIFWGLHPIRLSQWDASNIIGRSAFSGGLSAAALGLIFHFLVCVVWAAIFWLIMRAYAPARLHPVQFGLLFGVVVMAVMLWVVVPLGHASTAPMTVRTFIPIVTAHTFFFGLPVALTLRRTVWATARE